MYPELSLEEAIERSNLDNLHGLFVMSEYDYRQAPGLSQSILKEFARSPAHGYAAMSRPSVETPAKKHGAAVHCMVLEPDKFHARYVKEPKLGGPKNRKPWKDEWDAFKEEHQNNIILTEDEWYTCIGIDENIDSSRLHKAIRYGHSEISAFWRDPECGLLMKARFDKWAPDRNLVWDLKTTEDARPYQFSISCR